MNDDRRITLACIGRTGKLWLRFNSICRRWRSPLGYLISWWERSCKVSFSIQHQIDVHYKLLLLKVILLKFAKIQYRGFVLEEVMRWQLLLPLVPN
jgi:hypothetical protein